MCIFLLSLANNISWDPMINAEVACHRCNSNVLFLLFPFIFKFGVGTMSTWGLLDS